MFQIKLSHLICATFIQPSGKNIIVNFELQEVIPRRWSFASSRKSLCYWIQDQILSPSDLFVFCYSYVKVSQLLYTNPRISKNEWELTNKVDGRLLVFSWNQLIFKQDYQLSIQTVTRRHMRLFLIYINPWKDFFFFHKTMKIQVMYLLSFPKWNVKYFSSK